MATAKVHTQYIQNRTSRVVEKACAGSSPKYFSKPQIIVATESQNVGKNNPSRSCVMDCTSPPWMMNRAAIDEQTKANMSKLII